MRTIDHFLKQRKQLIYTFSAVLLFVVLTVLMVARVFRGTEITDEAFYIANAIQAVEGNLPYAYNNAFTGVGFIFLEIPIVFLYKLVNPEMTGIVLVTRLCFALFRLVCLFAVYRILKKRINRYVAFLLVCVFIPIHGSLLSNFSYNTIPFYLMMVSAFMLYDIIENHASHYRFRSFFAGFLSAIACFAHPLYVFALVWLGSVGLLRPLDSKRKAWVAGCYILGLLTEILIVFIPILLQAGYRTLAEGLYRLFVNPFPCAPLIPGMTLGKKLESLIDPAKQTMMVLFTVSASFILIRGKNALPLAANGYDREGVILALSYSLFVNLLYVRVFNLHSEFSASLGFVCAIYAVFFLLIGAPKKDPLYWYIGIYPVLFSVADIVMASATSTIHRFYYCLPALIAILSYLFILDRQPIRWAGLMICVLMIINGYVTNNNGVYRDAAISELNHRVTTGVYAGLYTTETRVHDLPELEAYLNSVIGEDERYAFRDNVPGAYLMLHKGVVCEPSSWDMCAYTYGRNTPAALFDYYRRRNMIPDKIIYIDYGRDSCLSIENENYRYNDFVHAYYDLVDDFELNETFKHIMVYAYNGKFDGNIDWWIQNYYDIAVEQ